MKRQPSSNVLPDRWRKPSFDIHPDVFTGIAKNDDDALVWVDRDPIRDPQTGIRPEVPFDPRECIVVCTCVRDGYECRNFPNYTAIYIL